MRMSALFGRTQREVPSGTEVAGHGMLLRAGFVRPLAAGVFSYLPLARRSLDKISDVLREEMEAYGGQEVSMPVVHPAEIWERSGRYSTVGPELVRLRDRRDRAMVLASAGVEVLYDDRRESLGTKFKDADLIGAPARLTLMPRSLNSGGVEMKLCRERGSRIVPVDEAVEVVQQRLSELEAELLGTDSRR
jgi:prolyl-tRNA synthetase